MTPAGQETSASCISAQFTSRNFPFVPDCLFKDVCTVNSLEKYYVPSTQSEGQIFLLFRVIKNNVFFLNKSQACLCPL